MATMMPSFTDDDTPPGEKVVFNMLAAGPDDWVALHSLDLAPWNRSRRTEIDFVVFIPKCGIICIEVKSHPDISFDGLTWSPASIKRSPFKQALDGSHTFYRRLSIIAPHLSTVPVIHLCIFPASAFDLHPNLSIRPVELMDCREFRSFRRASDFCNSLSERIIKAIRDDSALSPLIHPLNTAQINNIVEICLPVQKRKPGERVEINRRAEDAEKILLEQQKPVLQLAASNPRMIVTGGAGTGKTLIAIELARRLAETGSRVAFLCFNKIVGEWLKGKMASIRPPLPNLIVGRAIFVMAEMMELDIPTNADAVYWRELLPAFLEEKLTDPDLRDIAQFDYIILDEAQDILIKPKLWACLVQFLRGGVKDGKFILFGDFEHQVLGEIDVLKTTLENIICNSRPVMWSLTENCRNYSIVGQTAVRLSGITGQVYTGFLRKGGGVANYNINFYGNMEDQSTALATFLREYGKQGYSPEEITILSFKSDDTCVSTVLLQRGFKLIPAWQHGKFTRFCSVHAYKGMENKVIIITDVSLGMKDISRNLFYTGMTRAVESIRILCDMNSQNTLLDWLKMGGQTSGRKI